MMILQPQSGAQCPHTPRPSLTRWLFQRGILCLLSATLLAGCISTEQYEAEKTRGLNFQRLLAQEERRVNALNNQLAQKEQQIEELKAQLEETKRQIASGESQNRKLVLENRDLTVELDALREQNHPQQEKEPAVGSPAPSENLDTKDMPLSEISLSDPFITEEDLMNILESESNAVEIETQ